jgi:thiamine-phosphate pyrophosphorylase
MNVAQTLAAQLRLLVITDRHIMTAAHGSFAAALRAAFASSPMRNDQRVWLLVRDKDASSTQRAELLAEARSIVPSAVPLSMSVVDDKADFDCGASITGIHLPEAQSLAKAHRITALARNQDLVIGCSRHRASDVGMAAQQGAQYVQLGPVWDTPAKRLLGQPIGLQEITSARRSLDDIVSPARLVAVGGIHNAHRASLAIAAGAHAVACIGAIWNHPAPNQMIQAILAAAQ